MTEHEKLKEIARLLIKNNHKERELGLLTGKTGKVIFFFLYFQFTSNGLYKDFAEALLEDVCEEVNNELYFDYRKGICGIGWGLDYLIHNRFVQIENNDFFEDLDNTLLNNFPNMIESGYCSPKDIALYALSRYSHDNPELIPACKTTFIPDLIGAVNAHGKYDTASIENNLRLLYEGKQFKCDHNLFLVNEINRERKLNLVSEGLLLLISHEK